jgi:hypothetical protein
MLLALVLLVPEKLLREAVAVVVDLARRNVAGEEAVIISLK